MPKPSADDRKAPIRDQRKKIELIHERFDYAVDRWKEIREQRKEDMRHVAGDPWEPKEKLQRQQNMRPVPACDELGQYLNQVVNDVRANKRAIRFSPVGFGANDNTATFYADKTREIEYRSHAEQHYTRAFQNMVEGSYGYVKVGAEYETDKPGDPTKPWSAFNKRLTIGGVPDPDTIFPDPDFLDPAGRDWQWLFEIETQTIRDFRRNHPKAQIQSFSPELVKFSNGWISGKGDSQTLRIASYWEIEKIRKQLCAYELTNPETGADEVYELFTDDDAEFIEKVIGLGGEKVAEREVEDPKVTQYRTNGVEILQTTPWLGRRIPYVSFFGKMIWLDLGTGPQLMIMSMTRLARNPNMLLAYYLACEAEMIGITPKVPWWVWKGSVDKKNAIRIQEANHKPVAFIEIDPKMSNLGGSGADTPSLPQRIPFEPPIQAIEIAKESARRSIQAAVGLSPLPTSAQRRNEKSGVALKQIEESGQRGSYHFIDSYDMGIVAVGELLEDCIPKYYDTMGETPVLDNQKRPTNVFINAQNAPEGMQLPEDALPSIEGLHAVTIDVGPDFASERQQSSDFVDTFVASPFYQAMLQMQPQKAFEIFSLLIKLKNLGPIGEEIANLVHPPEQDDQTVPRSQFEQLKQAGDQAIKALQAELQRLTQEKQAKIVETQGKMAVVAQQDAAKARIADKDNQTAVLMQQMKDEIDRLKIMMDAHLEQKRLNTDQRIEGEKMAHATVMSARDQLHASHEAGESRAHEAAEGDKTRAHASDEAAADRETAAQEGAEERQAAMTLAQQKAAQPKGKSNGRA